MSDLTIREFQEQAHQVAKEHGWWEKDRNIGELLALIHSEVSEALEEWRAGRPLRDVYFGVDWKPEGFPTELADILIRVADMAEHYGIDLTEAVTSKMAYNRQRPYRHGSKIA